VSEGALSGVRVLDLTDERGIYGAKLVADLGADVIRPELPEGDPLRRRGPFVDSTDDSLWHAFFATNRRFIRLDLEDREDLDTLRRLARRADIVLTSSDAFGVAAADLDAARRDRPELIVVDTTSFGDGGPWQHYLAPDLVAGALGGAVATTGDVDTPPLKTYGDLNFMVSGVYVAIAALAALHAKHEHGTGQRVGVSVHECIASCLEQVFMMYWYAPVMNRQEEQVLPRRGAVHWTNLYAVYPARDGSIMVTPTPDIDAQLVWLIEEDAHQDLMDPMYSKEENFPLMMARMMEVLREWVASKDVEQLFLDAQGRHSPYGWVLPVEKLAENPQLAARDWFAHYRVGDKQVKGPGAPYQFSDTRWTPSRVLEDVGWEDKS
jgi:crotonobetainyl-CoA:carnitine CoA-transferase CaiB-like acyl-CoA transferase